MDGNQMPWTLLQSFCPFLVYLGLSGTSGAEMLDTGVDAPRREIPVRDFEYNLHLFYTFVSLEKLLSTAAIKSDAQFQKFLLTNKFSSGGLFYTTGFPLKPSILRLE